MDDKLLVLSLLKIKGWGPAKVVNFALKHSLNLKDCINSLKFVLNEEQQSTFESNIIIAKKEIDDNEIIGNHLITVFDKRFPKKLYSTTQKSCFLYYKGDIELLSSNSVAVIGTRHPSEVMSKKGYELASELAKRYTIVSGLAIGCDSIGHKACLDVGGKTIAVLPFSCDNVQPISNRNLAKSIVDNGGLLISEYGTGTPYNKNNYIERDRLQSLLSNYIFVIEANEKSGTMVAVRKSIKDGKSVYALKGNSIKEIKKYIDLSDLNRVEKEFNFVDKEDTEELVQMSLFDI